MHCSIHLTLTHSYKAYHISILTFYSELHIKGNIIENGSHSSIKDQNKVPPAPYIYAIMRISVKIQSSTEPWIRRKEQAAQFLNFILNLIICSLIPEGMANYWTWNKSPTVDLHANSEWSERSSTRHYHF